MEQQIKQCDRVSYSYGMKVSDGNYGSKDVHFSYSTDVISIEHPETAMHRAKEFVMHQVELMKPPASGTASQPQQAPPGIKPIQSGVQATAPPNGDLGAYVVGFGKHKGMALSTIDKLEGYLDWIKGLGNAKGKVAEFIKEATMYLGATKPAGGFNPGEEIPF